MKTLSLCVFSILSVYSAQIWTHPNVEAALPDTFLAPGAVQLTFDSIESEFPQNYIWFSGVWVGYFANEWRAPVWTTVAAAPPEFIDDSPQGEYDFVPAFPVQPPAISPILIAPPPIMPIIHIVDSSPVPDPHIVQSNVPEPGFLTLWPLWILGGAILGVKRKIGHRRRSRPCGPEPKEVVVPGCVP